MLLINKYNICFPFSLSTTFFILPRKQNHSFVEWDVNLTLSHGVSQQLIESIGTRVLKHIKEVEIKQFSEEFIDHVSRLSLRSAPLRGNRFVYIFVYIMKSVFYFISNHNLCISIIRIHYILIT